MPYLRASARIWSATSSWPFDTTIGAGSARVYRSATEMCVGFETMTVAVFTFAIERFQASDLALARIRPFIFGSPSWERDSSMTSLRDIFRSCSSVHRLFA